MAATVFVFTGRAYHGKPGIDWQMAEVQEDYAERRPFKGAWAKAQSWMVANGYRKLWATPVGRDGCDVTQVWGLVRVFGDTNVTYTGAYAVKAAYEHWQEAERERQEQSRRITQLILSAPEEGSWRPVMDQIKREFPELSARDAAEEAKARMAGGTLYPLRRLGRA